MHLCTAVPISPQLLTSPIVVGGVVHPIPPSPPPGTTHTRPQYIYPIFPFLPNVCRLALSGKDGPFHAHLGRWARGGGDTPDPPQIHSLAGVALDPLFFRPQCFVSYVLRCWRISSRHQSVSGVFPLFLILVLGIEQCCFF